MEYQIARDELRSRPPRVSWWVLLSEAVVLSVAAFVMSVFITG
jgi:hypothetical protein